MKQCVQDLIDWFKRASNGEGKYVSRLDVEDFEPLEK
jgi:hypothetical protein